VRDLPSVNTTGPRIKPEVLIQLRGSGSLKVPDLASRRHLMAERQNHEYDARTREEEANTPRDSKGSSEEPTILVRKDGTTAESYGPERGYSRPPFRVRNMANLRHSGYSDRVISAVAAEVVAVELLEIVCSSPGGPPTEEDPEKSPEG
jgi:hypothetical protein